MKKILSPISLMAIFIILVNCKPMIKENSFLKNTAAAVINGAPVNPNEILSKSVVGLMMNYEISDGNQVWIQGCTGSVLNQKFILTAAHCVANQHAENLAINFSLNSVTSEQQINPKTRITDIEKSFKIRKVKSFVQHPLYDGSGKNDLALILLESEVPADAISVVILPDQYIDLAGNKTLFDQKNITVILMGFGLINETPITETDVLRQATVPAVFQGEFVITDQTKGFGGCNGDSGGPAFFTFESITYQVGVTHGPHGDSTTCHQQGEWSNPALNKDFLKTGQEKLLSEK